MRLYLNTFRGEPAISGFAWHFTPTHRSSLPFAIEMGSGLHARVPHASPCPWVDHPVSGRLPATCRPFGLAFAPAPAVPALTSRRTTTRRLILQKARRHTYKKCSDCLEAHGFRLSFTPLAGVLFTVPSRYWFPIGRLLYLALGRGRPCFPPDSACRMVLTITSQSRSITVTYGTLTPSGRPFQRRSASHEPKIERSVPRSTRLVLPHDSSAYQLNTLPWFGLLPFRSPLLRESSLFLGVLRCFSSPGAPLSIRTGNAIPRAGLPHSDTPGSPVASSSPGHFAAWPRPSSAAGAKASTVRSSSWIMPLPTSSISASSPINHPRSGLRRPGLPNR